jgi:uncharacterized protein
MMDRIADGRTDFVFDYVAAGNPATSKDRSGTSLLAWCAYYGDVSAIKFLISKGESLKSLGDNLAGCGKKRKYCNEAARNASHCA